MSQANVNEELLHLRKRARRRLLGAIALVVFALIVLWTVLDNAPPPQFSTGHPIEITSSAPALIASQVVAVVQPASSPAYLKPPVDAGEPPIANVVAPVAASEIGPSTASLVARSASQTAILPGKLVNHQVKPVVAAKPKPASTPAQKVDHGVDPRKILNGLEEAKSAPKPTTVNKYFLQLGAFGDSAKAAQLTAKIKGAGMPVISEKVTTSKGQVLTRIRVGPAPTETKAQEWRKKAEAMGVAGKVVR